MLFPRAATLVALTAASNARPHLVPRQASASAFASSNDQSLKLSSQDAPLSGAGNANGASVWSIQMDDSASGARQTINGFGAAVTDGTVSNYDALPADQQQKLLNDLVGSSGANFQLIRHTVASSDMSPNEYSYDDNGGQPDPNGANFNLGDSGNAMAAMLKDMRGANGNLTILGSSWHAPDWMKNSDNTFNADQYSDQFAQYFVKYLQAFEAAGAPIDAVTIQNEPLHNDANDDHDFTMGLSADVEGDLFQNHFGPAFDAAGINTKLVAFDHNTNTDDYPRTVLDAAAKYTSTVGWHCYAPGGPDWTVLSRFHDDYPDAEQWMTECYTFDSDPWTQTLGFTFGPLQNWATGVISWPMGTATDGSPYLPNTGSCSSCRGLFEVDGGAYQLTTDYYMLAQFSKGLAKGSTVHGVSGNYFYGDGTGVDSVSAVNADGTRTLVVQNNFNNPLYLTLNTTSGEQWSGTLYPESVTTWLLPAAAAQ